MYLTRQPRGSHPFVESLDKSAFLIEYGGVAQLGERTVRIRKVKGSNPSVSTNLGKSGFRLPLFSYRRLYGQVPKFLVGHVEVDF